MFGIGIALAVAVGAAEPRRGNVPPGTVIGAVPVGGLPVAVAIARLDVQARPGDELLRVETPTTTIRVPVASLHPRPRSREAVRRAVEADGYWDRLRRAAGLGTTHRVPIRFALTAEGEQRLFARIARAVDRPARPAAVVVRPGRVTIVAARPGRRLDRAAFRHRVALLPPRVVAPIRSARPAITTAEAMRARDEVRRLRRPVRVTFDGTSVTIPAEAVGGLLRVHAHGRRLKVDLDAERLAIRLERALPGLVVPARSASFRVRGRRVTVAPARAGRELDAPATARAIAAGSPGQPVPAVTRAVAPRLTTREARRLRIRELVAQFSTPYTCCPPRVTNIRRGVEILDGTVIPPGGPLSLNAVLGERTPERGFVPAPQINAGELEDAVGGGVSQIATTLFNAAFFAGLRLDRFTPHEFWISRYPAGREATISWGGPELVVTNDWPAGLLVRARATDDAVTIRLYSSRLGRRVVTTTETPSGTVGAFSVRFTRKVFRGRRLIRDETFRWSYRAPPAE
jgi:vancomycin resistance protein YoaR